MSYGNPSKRVEDLLGQMTLVEKAFQLVGLMPMALLGPQGLDPDKVNRILGQGIGQISAPGLFGYKAPPQMAALT